MTDYRNPVGQQPNSSFLFAIKLLGHPFTQKSSSKDDGTGRKQNCKDKAEMRGEGMNAREQGASGAWR